MSANQLPWRASAAVTRSSDGRDKGSLAQAAVPLRALPQSEGPFTARRRRWESSQVIPAAREFGPIPPERAPVLFKDARTEGANVAFPAEVLAVAAPSPSAVPVPIRLLRLSCGRLVTRGGAGVKRLPLHRRVERAAPGFLDAWRDQCRRRATERVLLQGAYLVLEALFYVLPLDRVTRPTSTANTGAPEEKAKACGLFARRHAHAVVRRMEAFGLAKSRRGDGTPRRCRAFFAAPAEKFSLRRRGARRRLGHCRLSKAAGAAVPEGRLLWHMIPRVLGEWFMEMCLPARRRVNHLDWEVTMRSHYEAIALAHFAVWKASQ